MPAKPDPQPKLITRKSDFKTWRSSLPPDAQVGLVPTMGALHPGHLSLFSAARELRPSTHVVGTVFVNPTQFGPGEDLDRYPRTLDRDLALLAELGATAAPDVVFAPDNPTEMYAPDSSTWVQVDGVSEPWCGRFRPGHFRGVATVVLKLIHLAQPRFAFFGDKDFQQLAVLTRMARDLDLETEIIGCPTVREKDGLAMSSRNAYLTPAERSRAPILYETLRMLAGRLARGDFASATELEAAGIQALQRAIPEFSLQYLEARDAESLDSLENMATWRTRPVAIALAGYLGTTRLIDHVVVTVERQKDGRTRNSRGVSVPQ